MPAAQKASEQGRTLAHGAAYQSSFHGCVLRDRALVGLVLPPADVALVMVNDEHRPVLPGDAHPLGDALATVLQFHSRRGLTISISACVDRVGQDAEDGLIHRQSPVQSALLALVRDAGQFDAFLTQPNEDLANAAEIPELLEHEAD